MPFTFSEDIPTLREEWRKAIDELPSTPDNIPAFFLAHGQPLLVWPTSVPPPSGRLSSLFSWGGAKGPLAQFLDDFGPALMKKYQPKGIVVFSAHWETRGERLVSDYGETNPLLYDFYGFIPQLYEIEFKSRGDSSLTRRVLDAFKSASIPARASPISESRGQDGKTHQSVAGFDHGVFVPFLRMFGSDPSKTYADFPPIVEVSLDESLDVEKNWKIGEAMASLRKEGYLVIAGGLTIHSFENNMEGFSIKTANPKLKDFDASVIEAAGIQDPEARKAALKALTSHPGFRASHPREEHFIPLYIAAGAGAVGEGTGSKVLSRIYGQSSFAFGL